MGKGERMDNFLNETVKINKYLTESEKIIKAVKEEDRVLIQAPCGVGKTYLVVNEIKGPIILAVPLTAIKDQTTKDYGLYLAGGNGGSLKRAIEKGEERIVCCYESLKSIMDHWDLVKDYVLVIDEFHSLLTTISYRDNIKLLKNLDKFKRSIFLTATPQIIAKSVVKKIIKVKSKEVKNYDVTLLKPKNERWSKAQYIRSVQKIMELSKESNIPAWYVGNKAGYFKDHEAIITASNKNKNYRHQHFMEGILRVDETYITTDIYNTGININNTGEITIIIDYTGESLNVCNFLQLIGRFRKADKINIFILDRGRTDHHYTRELVEIELKQVIKDLEKGASIKTINNLIPAFKNAIYYKDNSWGYDEIGLDIAQYLYNSFRNTTEGVLKKAGLKIDRVIRANEYLGPEEEKGTRKNRTPKTLLKNIVDKDDINFMDLVSYLNRKALNENYDWMDISVKIDKAIFENEKVNRVLKKLMDIDRNTCINNLREYIGDLKKFDELVIKDMDKCKNKILELKSDTKRLGATKKILNKYSIDTVGLVGTNPNVIKSLLKEKFNITTKQVKSSVTFKL
jgi:hypothetical protein